MNEAAPTATATTENAQAEAVQAHQLQTQFESGANWFYWIAGLSLLNSAIALFQGQWAFIVGLGVTQIFDGLAIGIAEAAPETAVVAKGIAFGADLLAAGIFVVFGVLARKQQHWAFVTGMVIYAVDGLIFLAFGDFLGLGFHAFALWCLWRGLVASRRLKAQAAVDARFEAPAA